MTKQEVNDKIEAMNDVLCEMCTSYQDCDCQNCDFSRPISISGLPASIAYSIDMGAYTEISVVVGSNLLPVMAIDGRLVAICDDSGLIKLDDAPANDVRDFSSQYAEFDEKAWEDAPKCQWNEAYQEWEAIIDV